MKKKFCPKCGKETEKFYDNLCEECFIEKISFKNLIPEKILLKECKNCGGIFYKNKRFISINEAVEEILAKIFEGKQVKEFFYEILDGKVHASFWMRINDLEKREEKTFWLLIKRIVCKACFMKSTSYYQAILQLRATKDILNEILGDVEKELEILRKKDELAFISKLEEVKNGFNLYIGSKKAAFSLLKILKRKFNGKIKISRKLGSIKKGEKMYRYTILISVD